MSRQPAPGEHASYADLNDRDHVAFAKGQTVHCDRAFLISAAFPDNFKGRFLLGFELGAGLVSGACAIAVFGKVLTAILGLFA